MVELRFEEAEDDDDAADDDVGYLTVAGFYSYRLDDGGQLVAAPRYAGDDDEEYTHGEAFALGWFIGSDGLLCLMDDEDSTRYSPVDIETLVEWGFDDQVIDQVVDAARSQGMPLIETFNEKDAERLKGRYRDRVERGDR